MNPLTENGRQAKGLRQRKKEKVRAEVQRQALLLFRTRGYAATTIEQIAEAAEVSPSTFFRYFATKEDLVMYNIIDPVVMDYFRNQPSNLSPTRALQAAIRLVRNEFSANESADLKERTELMRGVPELRAKMLDKLTQNLEVLAELTGERTGRPAADAVVRTFAGAAIGVVISVLLNEEADPQVDVLHSVDLALDRMETELPLHAIGNPPKQGESPPSRTPGEA